MTAVSICELCEGTGWKPLMVDGVRRVARCECFTASLGKTARGVPAEFRDASLDSFLETPANCHAKAFMVRWVEGHEQARDVYLFGAVGTGKTRLACSVLNDVFRHTRTGLFVRVPMLLLRLQPSAVEESELFWRCCEAPLLVLDDVGSEREHATDFTRRTLLMLYEERGDRGLRTIWTSNQSLVALGDFMQDERLASRIKGRSDVVELSGSDWRVRRR